MGSASLRLGVVADDLTGAMDTGVQFAKGGLHTVVMLGDGDLPPAEMVVVSTDSRDLPAPEAYRRAREAAERLGGRRPYKKIDSTFRGNIGPELDGLLDGLGLERALVTPAFPATGRTTIDGYLRVHGVLLEESAFALDPQWPAAGSHLPTLLAGRTRRAVGHLPLSVVVQGAEAVARALGAEPAPVVVADAVELDHLRSLALALARMAEPWLPVGSAGLAEEWLRALGLEPAAPHLSWDPDPRPVLVVAGSRHPATARQLKRAVQEGCLEVIDLEEFRDGESGILERATAVLNAGKSVALATTFSPYQEGQAQEIAETLALCAVRAMERTPVAGLFVTGGDIARALCRALRASALRALGEVQAGVPAGELVGGPHGGMRVVTKAGGFGDDLALRQSIDLLRGKRT